ncbi:type II toxin-antitoxin system RelE/ParE family toxin [Jiella mangrovi]|uniref:Type II toxin-antitoxin system RelE/ParE family toxin n=1 Tax=Jiella mangrovi TaxID=2821407 RepID=A0ABS4BHQ5_9HYPH|nr:type II toxin-antitoxin system RelE/ParE family toxin [Jiella mangrovi]
MRKIVWARAARTEFREAMRYLGRHDRSAARLVSERISAAVLLVAKHPVGRPTKIPGVYVKLIVKTPYVMTHRANVGEIEILRLIHQRQSSAPSGDASS